MAPDTDDACYLALKARDARFDGRFFTGVTSTGIYCRPVCRVKTPRRENCRFFGLAAQAEAAGFRPCLRCRPELAPHDAEPPWNLEDATRLLALAAARLLDQPEPDGGDSAPSTQVVARTAERLGVSDRHLRRLFQAHWGLSPLQYLQTRRLLNAKLLLTSTRLPVAEVARLSGFGSERRFHATWRERYGLPPLQLRQQSRAGALVADTQALRLTLGWRPPLDVKHLLGFLAQRAIDGVEFADVASSTWGSTLTLQAHRGWVLARFDTATATVQLDVAPGLQAVLPQVLRRVRDTLDLDLDPAAVDAVLLPDFPDSAGRRVPGALDPFAMAVRAVLGQQVTVAAACTLARRVVDRWGEPVDTPHPLLTRVFPHPEVLAHASADDLGACGITRQRQAAIQALARALMNGELRLAPGADIAATHATLVALPGIGTWTAQYLAMRALRWPDAFPAGDVALHLALGVREAPPRERVRLVEARAESWRPWRAYAVIRAWAALTELQKDQTP